MGCLKRSQVVPTDDDKVFYGDNTITKTRTCTDIFYLILMLLFLIGHIYFMNYCLQHGDINRIIRGYDFCGNICGVNNEPDINYPCKGTDHTENKFYLIEAPDLKKVPHNLINRRCVKDCDHEFGFKAFLNRCIKNDKFSINASVRSFFSKTGIAGFFEEICEDIVACWAEIIGLFCMAFVLSLLTVFFLRYIVGCFVWIILIGTIVVSIIASIFCWIQYYDVVQSGSPLFIDDRNENTWLAFSIIATVCAVVFILITIVLRKRIQLVIALIREAGKALCHMPSLLFEPLLTFLSLSILCCIWLYCHICIESSGFLTMDSNNSAEYIKDTTIIVARWYNIFIFVWLTYFFIGCQHIIIAGSVAIWFFTRNKDTLKRPLLKSMHLLLCYHLGTVAVGSFLISLLKAVRYFIKKCHDLSKKAVNPNNKCIQCICYPFQCCLYCFDKFLQFITRNAYILTAIYGYSFYKAAKESFKILVTNALRVATINSVGDFILILAKLFVTTFTGFIAVLIMETHENLHYKWSPVVIVVIFAYLTSHTFISVYEMTIDTIFLCFCIDCEVNDGISKPYYMSRGLMEFVVKSKKLLGVSDNLNNKGREAWSRNNAINTNYIDNNNNNNDKLITISETVN